MGFASNPGSSGSGASIEVNDDTRTTRTGTTYTNHATYTGLTTTADTLYRITVRLDTDAGGAGNARLRFAYGDGSNEDDGDEIRCSTATGATEGTFVMIVGAKDASTLTSVQESTTSAVTASGSDSDVYEVVGTSALTNTTSWVNITQIRLEAKSNNAGQAVDVNHVVIEKIVL